MLSGSPSRAGDVQRDCELTLTLGNCGGFKICPQIRSHTSLQEEEPGLHPNSPSVGPDSFLTNTKKSRINGV